MRSTTLADFILSELPHSQDPMKSRSYDEGDDYVANQIARLKCVLLDRLCCDGEIIGNIRFALGKIG